MPSSICNHAERSRRLARESWETPWSRLPSLDSETPESRLSAGLHMGEGISFFRAMLCISAAYAVMRCLSVCVCVRVSVTFVSCQNE